MNKYYEEFTEKRFCKNCGKELIPSEIDGYQWQCLDCDEDFCNFETLTLDYMLERYKGFEF